MSLILTHISHWAIAWVSMPTECRLSSVTCFSNCRIISATTQMKRILMQVSTCLLLMLKPSSVAKILLKHRSDILLMSVSVWILWVFLWSCTIIHRYPLSLWFIRHCDNVCLSTEPSSICLLSTFAAYTAPDSDDQLPVSPEFQNLIQCCIDPRSNLHLADKYLGAKRIIQYLGWVQEQVEHATPD